jgi:hypothetical protein
MLEAKATQSQAKASGFQARPSQNITSTKYVHQDSGKLDVA